MLERRTVNIKKPVVITESKLREIIKDVLFETMSSFPNQYEVAKICTNEFSKMFDSGIKEKTIEIRKSGINNIILQILEGRFLSKVNVQFNENNIIISIGEDNWCGKNFNVNSLYDKIVHELMHGNIYLSRDQNIENKSKIEDTPESYDKLIELLNILDENTLVYNYTYALYSCYYQEMQAIISQTYSSMKSICYRNKIEVVDRSTFEELFKKSSPYQTFKNNIYICDVIDELDDSTVKKEIIDVYTANNLITDIYEIRKNSTEIRRLSNRAIHKCMRNASIFYYELLNNRNF